MKREIRDIGNGKLMKRFPVIAIIALLFSLPGLAWAQQPKLKADHFELLVHPDAKIVSEFDNGWETKMVVEHEGQRVRINWRGNQALILFPTSTMRLKVRPTADGEAVTCQVNSEKYEVIRSPREIGWKLPGQEVFFRTTGGKITQAVGTADFLKVRRNTPAGRVTLESSAGVTDALLRKGKLETFDGPEIGEHVYMVRGLAFQKGPITVRLPLPGGPFLEGLPEDRFLLVKRDITPLPEPTSPAPEEREKDPLQADPYTWSSPELRARSGDPEKDPLHVRKENRVKHPSDPLKANTGDDPSVLEVQDY